MHYMGLFFLDGKWIYLLRTDKRNVTTNCYLPADHRRLPLVSADPLPYWYPATYHRYRDREG